MMNLWTGSGTGFLDDAGILYLIFERKGRFQRYEGTEMIP